MNTASLRMVAVMSILCGACEKKPDETHRRESPRTSQRHSPSNIRSAKTDIGKTIERDIDAAKRDPLMKQRHADFVRDLDEDPENANDPESPGTRFDRKEARDLMSLYAAGYQLAGLEWIFTFDDPRYAAENLLVDFVMELQASSPGSAMKLLKQMESPAHRGEFAEKLAWHSRRRDFESMWDYLLDPITNLGSDAQLSEVKRTLVGAQARVDPEGAWDRFRNHLPASGDERDFPSISWGRLEPEISFPVVFLDHVLANGHDVLPSVRTAIWHCTSPQNISPIESWLERNQAGFDFKAACSDMGKWWRSHDVAASEVWHRRAN